MTYEPERVQLQQAAERLARVRAGLWAAADRLDAGQGYDRPDELRAWAHDLEETLEIISARRAATPPA